MTTTGTTTTTVALLFLLNNTDPRRPVPFTAQFPQMKRLLQEDPERRFKVYAMCTAGDDRNLDDDFRKSVSVFRKASTPPVYGKKSLAMAMAELLRAAFVDSEQNTHFVFMSESCLPMWNPDVIYTAITQGLWGPMTWMSRWEPREHCCFRAGQQFITCRDHATIVLDSFDTVLASYDDSTWAVDELVFLETLRNAAVPNVLHHAEGPTFVDWERPKGSHPHEFGPAVSKEDLFRLLASDALFCRKVTSETSDLRRDDLADLFLNRDFSWWKMTHEDKGSAHHVFNTFRLMSPF
jgi:hypothetical protein